MQLKSVVDQLTDTASRSAGSMQTPPPTSTSVLRRKGESLQMNKTSNESAIDLRRMSTPTGLKSKKGESLSSQVEESPLHLGSLQFSPDGFAFSMSGSATVPAYPQHKLFWDSHANADGMNIDFSYEPFDMGLENSKIVDPFTSAHQKGHLSHLPSSSSLNEVGIKGSHHMDMENPTNRGSASQTDFTPSGLMIRNVPKGVNPSLLFSSPSRPPQQSNPIEKIPNEALQPYASQVRDAQMDKEPGLDRAPKRRRKLYEDSPAVKAALQALREDTNSRTSTEEISDEVVPVQSRPANIRKSRVASKAPESSQRLGSSRKMQTNMHHRASVRPIKSRTAVTLTIDENGRAKTETKIIHESAESSGPFSEANIDMGFDSEDGESASSSESDEMVISQPTSFALSNQKAGKPKLARFVTDSKTHSQKSSYASTLAVSNVGYSMPLSDKPHRRTSSARRPGSSSHQESPTKRGLHRARPLTVISDDVDRFSDGRVIEVSSEVETMSTSDDDRGDAQSELKKILRVREQSRPSVQAGARKSSVIYSTSRTQIPAQLFGAMAFGQGDGVNTFENNSPTTITDPGLSTPGTGGESLAGEATRCVCPGYDIEGELMILWYVKPHLDNACTNRWVATHARIGYTWDASA